MTFHVNDACWHHYDQNALKDLIEGGVKVINLQDLVNGIDWIAGKFAGKVSIDLDIDRQQITAGAHHRKSMS